ncbi:hypothetical protein [Frankia sp. AvcI1]|uniref:hypothetical protein n=1 Tax=Frankia sp. AvcI1 TaxID=573496 RepID=UPI00211894AA|nr:hypothetical protein [Frankia sp. AvcI1]
MYDAIFQDTHVALTKEAPSGIMRVAEVVVPDGPTIAINIGDPVIQPKDSRGTFPFWGYLLDAEGFDMHFIVHPRGWTPNDVRHLNEGVEALRCRDLSISVLDAHTLRVQEIPAGYGVGDIQAALWPHGLVVAEVTELTWFTVIRLEG